MYEDTADDGSSFGIADRSESPGTTIGPGLLLRFIVPCKLAGGCSDTPSPIGADRLVLDLLSGREKLNDGRGRWLEFEASELIDGDRGCERAIEAIGECGIDIALLEDNLREFEKVEPALELL
jgi:hypothetical protein